MLQHVLRTEMSVDVASKVALLNIHERMACESAEVTFRSWTSRGVRTKKRRRFTALVADGSPCLISKIPLDYDDLKVLREWDQLTRLSFPAVINHPRAIEQTDGGFIMTYAPSEDLPDVLNSLGCRGCFKAFLRRTVEIVATMHMHGTISNCDTVKCWDAARQYVEKPYADDPRARAALEHAKVGPTHGDLAPWNVRVDPSDNSVCVIDWEDYQPAGISGIDVVNLLVTLGLVIFPEHRTRGWNWLYDQMFESEHWYALLMRREIRHYASLTHQSARLVVDLVPFFCQWLIARITDEGRDAGSLYYRSFWNRYVTRPPKWVEELSYV